jgi:hypothetical protein
VDTLFLKYVFKITGLPLAVVATKFDEVCLMIAEDANFLYKSPQAESAAKAISQYFGMNLSHVFPVVNYTNEKTINPGKDLLALHAIHGMMELTKAYLQKHRGN